ncbi:MAG: tetratricopeptide repeat protein [Lachnospiraceae bacterium]|nr:tetratricopeptide repeat protein [Lachnospiraceae bacterium]
MIEIRLFNTPQILKDSEIIRFPYRKAEGLLYYLSVKKQASREELISLLWADEEEGTGKKKLRDAIYQIKRALGKDLLKSGGNTLLSLATDKTLHIDYDDVLSGKVSADGLFLHHFYIKNCPDFEEWVEGVREDLQHSLEKTTRADLEDAIRRQDAEAIRTYSTILLQNDPYNENLYLEMMNLYAENGNYTMAIRIYHDLVTLLKKDMGVEPSEQVSALFKRIFNMKEHSPADSALQDLPFFGRKKELFHVSGFLDQDEKDRMNCLAIEGREGVGKTTFLEHALHLAEGKGMLVLQAVCYAQGMDFFLNPWRDIFREISQHAEQNRRQDILSGAAFQTLSGLFSDQNEDREDGRMFYLQVEHAFQELFRSLLSEQNILLAFDEIQWMDAPSLQLLVSLLRALPFGPLKMICTYDQNAGAFAMTYLEPLVREDRIHFLTLHPFSEQETAEIISHLLPEAASDKARCHEIYEMSGGNAFFLKEILNTLKEGGSAEDSSGKINFMFRTRRDALTPDQKELLSALSVFPGRISIDKVELLMGDMDRLKILNLLEALQEKDMIKEVLVGWNVYYQFVHLLFQNYIYDHMSAGKRQAYHRILAEDYEKRDPSGFSNLPKIAYHYVRCNEPAKAYPYQIRYLRIFYTITDENFPVIRTEVSDREDDLGMLSEAEQMLTFAKDIIQLKRTDPETARMKMEMLYILGRHEIAVGEYEQGVDHIEKSIQLSRELKETDNLLSCYKQMVYYCIQTGNVDEAETYVRLGLRGTKDKTGEDYAHFLRLKGWCQVRRRDFSKAKDTLNKAISLFRAEEEKKPGSYKASIAACLKYLGDIYRIQGAYDEALSYYNDALHESRGPVVTNGMAQIYSNIGQVRYYQERYAESFIHLDKAREYLERNGYFWGLERTECYLAMVCLKTGKTGEAKLHYEKASLLSEKVKNPVTENLLRELAVRF